MDPIGVGINQNVIISRVGITDKGQLEIELAHPGEKKSLFDQALTAGVQKEGKDTMAIKILSPLAPKATDKNQNPVPLEVRIERANGDIVKFRNQLTQILEQFMTLDQINLSDRDLQFAGTGIVDSASYEERIIQEDVLLKIYDNLAKRFIELMTPLVGKHDPVRFKLLRQSKDKHFATIPSRYISDQPFIELMSVPAEHSRVKFSKYEIDEGLNDGTPTSSSRAEKKESGSAPASAAPAVNPFAQPA